MAGSVLLPLLVAATTTPTDASAPPAIVSADDALKDKAFNDSTTSGLVKATIAAAEAAQASGKYRLYFNALGGFSTR